MIPADFDVHAWRRRNRYPHARIVDGHLVAVARQLFNWRLTITTDLPDFVDDDY